MRRFFGIVNLLAVFYVAVLITVFVGYITSDMQETEKIRLTYQIDLSSDAATYQLLRSGNLGIDYAHKNQMTLNPQRALDTFVDIFCEGYGISDSKENIAHVKLNFIPVACVVSTDGFYVATQRQVRNSNDYPENKADDVDYDLIFGPKMPYTYSNNGVAYGLTMNSNKTYSVTNGTLEILKGLPITPKGPMSIDEQWKIINDAVSNNIKSVADLQNESNPTWANSFYLPTRLTNLSGNNPIVGPSFIVLVQNLNLTTVKPIEAFSIGGTKISANRQIACYTVGVLKYYTYSDRIPTGAVVDIVVDNMHEAALAGYSPDVKNIR